MTKKNQAANDFAHDQKCKEFAKQYVLDFKAVAAYRRCNFKTTEKRQSDNAAASKLLATPLVQEYIQELSEERTRRLDVKVDTVVREQARIGFADIRNYFYWQDGRVHLKDSAMLDENASRAIERLEITEYESPSGAILTRTKIKLHSKAPALESLAKHLGMYTEKHQVEVNYGTVAVPAMTSPRDWMDVVRQEIAHVSSNGSSSHMESE